MMNPHVNIRDLNSILKRNGLLRGDPRLSEIFEGLDSMEEKYISFETFNEWRKKSALLEKSFSHELAFPKFSEFCSEIKSIFENCKDNNSGEKYCLTLS